MLLYKSYAAALASVAREQKNATTEDWEIQFGLLLDIFKSYPDLGIFFNNPGIPLEDKKKTLDNILIAIENFAKITILQKLKNFIKLLLDKRICLDAVALSKIFAEFIKICDRFENVLNVEITSAIMLSDEEIERLKHKYVKKYSVPKVRLNVTIDERLIGGMKVRIEDQIIDLSLREALENMKRKLVV